MLRWLKAIYNHEKNISKEETERNYSPFNLFQNFNSSYGVESIENTTIVIKREPNINVKVEENDEQLEILQEIAINNTQNQTSNVVQKQIEKMNTEKNQLLSDLLTLKEDYDRVCEKMNKKEDECCELIINN